MMTFRLIATDLDGTLLRSDGSTSEYTRDVLQRVAALVPIALVTARPPRTARLIAETLGVKAHLICCNGALVYDTSTSRVERHSPITVEDARRLIESLRRALPGVVFAAELELGYGCEPEYRQLMGPPGHITDPSPVLADALELCGVPVTKLIVRHSEHSASTLAVVLAAAVGIDFTTTYSGTAFLEISAGGVSKASALAALSTQLGVMRQHVLAFGDMRNDLPMMAWAGHSIAVANAHPEVLAAAHETVESNDDDGVARTLERLVLASV